MAASVAEFVERYALGASPAVHDLARDGVARVSVAADETTVPPEVAAVFAETVSLFALHLYVNSAGLLYVPLAAPREVPLAEPHADGEEPVTPLLRELGLDRRRGLARDEIEARPIGNGAASSPTTSASTRSRSASCVCRRAAGRLRLRRLVEDHALMAGLEESPHHVCPSGRDRSFRGACLFLPLDEAFSSSPRHRRNPPRKAFALLPARQRDGSSFEREVA